MKIVALGAERRQAQTELTLKIRFLGLSFLLVFALAVTAFARSEFSGNVVRVADGDIITVLAPGNQQVKVGSMASTAPRRAKPLARWHGSLQRTGLLPERDGKRSGHQQVRTCRRGSYD